MAVMATLKLVDELDEILTVDCHAYEVVESCKNVLNDIYNFKVLTFNIRSLQKNFDEFLIILSRLEIKFDVIILTECHLGTCSLMRTIPEYAYYSTSIICNRAGGVVAYIRSDWRVNVSEPNILDADSLLIELPNSYSILGVYRSPSVANVDSFLNSVDTVVRTHISEKRKILIAGDINLNILQDTNQVNEYLCLSAELGLKHLINLPTRSATCLDHILVDARAQAIGLVCNTDITDHNLVMAGIITSPHRIRKTRFSSKTDYNKIYNDLKLTDWSDILISTDVSKTAERFTCMLEDLVKKHTNQVRVSQRKCPLKEWITPGLLRCMKHRDALHTMARKNPYNIETQKTYKRYRNVFFDLIKDLKAKHNKRLIFESKNNPSKLWKNIKNICELNNKKDSNLELLNIDLTPSNSLNLCNNYFVNVGKNLAGNILDSLGKTEEELAANISSISSSPNSFFMSPTDSVEIRNIILSLKNDKAPGKDGLKNSLIKRLCPLILKPLTHIINLSLSSGIFPESWKTAAVIPIHKDGSKLNTCNYRPISLLPVFSKILEKVANVRLVNFLEKQNILMPFQFGFRRNRSTENAVTLLLESLATSIDNGQKCIGVFLDLAKAFDTVSPKILIRKLERIGIRGIALDWFSSYLSDRKQYVSLGGYKSSIKNLSFGVPQGSILGPTLFTIYINDISDVLALHEDTQVVCYADDTAILFKGKSWDSVFRHAETGLSVIAAWLDSNLLTLNAKKTQYLCFQKTSISRPSVTHEIQIHKNCLKLLQTEPCSCSKIERVTTIKYLGVTLDEMLSFKPHIVALSGRVRKLIHIMKLLREGADKELLMLVYVALCQSILTYCILAWGSAAKTFMIKVERAQRAVLKVMFGKPFRYPTKILYNETQTLSVRQLFIQKALLSHHKVFKLTSENLSEQKRRVNVKVPAVKSAFARRFCHYTLPFLYRRTMKLCNLSDSSLYGVKEKVRKWLLTLDYDATESLFVIQA